MENKKNLFNSKTWLRNKNKDEGGGEFRILENGKIFEKVGVNFQKFMEDFLKNLEKKYQGQIKMEILGVRCVCSDACEKSTCSSNALLIQDIYLLHMDGLVVAWMLHHVLKIIKQKIGFIKNLGKHVINMIKYCLNLKMV